MWKTNGLRKREFNRASMRQGRVRQVLGIEVCQSEAEHSKGTMGGGGVSHGRYSASSSSSSSLGRLLLLVILIPIPRASRASMAALAAPSNPFFCLARLRRRVPKACALMTASVGQMGGPLGGGDHEREFVALRETLLL